MTVLPSQKLTTGELFVSLAAGLMFFLLPNDAKNQFNSPVSEFMIFIISLVITFVLYFILKRFEAVGVAILTSSVLIVINITFNIFSGIFSKTKNYWPNITEYNLVSMFILWMTPFFCVTVLRLLMLGKDDTNNKRIGFSRFITLSIRAMLILYAVVIVFEMIIPYKPNIDIPRDINFIPFQRINECILNIHEDGMKYLLWHSLIFIPVSFSLLVLIPKISHWQIIIIAVTFGFTIEALQYSFNTGTACIDDIVMYLVGTVIGIIIKHTIDKARSLLTMGQDKCMLSTNYTPIKRKFSNNIFNISE